MDEPKQPAANDIAPLETDAGTLWVDMFELLTPATRARGIELMAQIAKAYGVEQRIAEARAFKNGQRHLADDVRQAAYSEGWNDAIREVMGRKQDASAGSLIEPAATTDKTPTYH